MYDSSADAGVVFVPKPGSDFVRTQYVEDLASRALDYVRAGLAVHFSGPSGVGKTTLALHVAAKIGRPVVIIHGDYELGAPELIGGIYGYHKSRVVDNFIRSVLRADESLTLQWSDGGLVIACKNGFTLVYDEFTRSRAETNNMLLSVLEERVLPVPKVGGHGGYIRVHPSFAAIFTSNPREYAGVQRMPDALLDRMATIEVGSFDEETEVAITHAKARVAAEDARRVVQLVRKIRQVRLGSVTPSVRSCILVGKLLSLKDRHAVRQDPVFERICIDVLLPDVPPEERDRVVETIRETIAGYGSSEETGETGAAGCRQEVASGASWEGLRA